MNAALLALSTSDIPDRMNKVAFLAAALPVLFLFMIIFHWKAFRLFILLMAADVVAIVFLLYGEIPAVITLIAEAVIPLMTRGRSRTPKR